jgi:proliferating cell nuclear antigen
MLNAIIDGKILKDYFESIMTVAAECRFHINENEIYTMIVDSAGVAMVKSSCKKGVFTDYTATPCEFGLSLQKIKSSLVAFNSKEYEIMFTESSMQFSIVGGRNKYSTRVLASETIRKDPPKDPNDFVLPSQIQVDGAALATAIKTVTTMCENKIVLEHKKGTRDLTIYSDDELDSTQSSIDSEKISVIKDDDGRSIFSSEYMKSLASVLSRADCVNVYLGKDMPIRFSLVINDAIEATYIVAPRIEN